MCDWGRVVKSGLLTGAVMLAASFLLMQAWNVMAPGLQAEYANPALFRPWSDPLMGLIFVHPFVAGLAMAYAYAFFREAFKKKARGIGWKFGFVAWVLASVPGMLVSYASFPVSAPMIFSWTASALVQMLLGGYAIAYVWEEK